jgi:cAMP-dependent protein kinase regulator
MGISAEVFGQFNKKAEFVQKVIPKDTATKEEIKRLIEKSILFQSLNKEDLGIVIDAMEEVYAEPGRAVITEGEIGDTLYIINEGEFDCFKVIGGK